MKFQSRSRSRSRGIYLFSSILVQRAVENRGIFPFILQVVVFRTSEKRCADLCLRCMFTVASAYSSAAFATLKASIHDVQRYGYATIHASLASPHATAAWAAIKHSV